MATAAFAACAGAFAEEQDRSVQEALSETERAEIPRDRFVRSGDECGASRYAHLLGERYAELRQALLRSDANVVDRTRAMTLEYRPGQLNLVLDGAGRVIAVGCF